MSRIVTARKVGMMTAQGVNNIIFIIITIMLKMSIYMKEGYSQNKR